MKNFKRLFSLSLALLMALSLCACGKDAKPSGTSGNKTDSKEEEVIDLAGHEITIASWWDDLPKADSNDEKHKLRYARMKELEEEYNCTFKAVVVEQTQISSNLRAAVLAGDVFADVIFMRADSTDQFMASDVFLPVGDYIDLTQRQYNQSINQQYTKDGKVYAFSTYDNNIESLVFFNKDIFSKVGLEEPYQLVKDKKWTWDVFKTYVAKATITSASSSIPEVYGFYGVNNGTGTTQVLKSLGAEFVHKDNKGVYTSALRENELTTGHNFIREMNTTWTGVYKPAKDASWSEPGQKFIDGKVAMVITGFTSAEKMKAKMTDKFGIVPIPLAKEGDEYISISETHNVRVMQSNMDDKLAKKVATVYDKLMAPLYTEDEEKEKNISSYEQVLCDDESVDIIVEMKAKENTLFNQISAAGNTYYKFFNDLRPALIGETTIATVIATHESALDEAIMATNNGE